MRKSCRNVCPDMVPICVSSRSEWPASPGFGSEFGIRIVRHCDQLQHQIQQAADDSHRQLHHRPSIVRANDEGPDEEEPAASLDDLPQEKAGTIVPVKKLNRAAESRRLPRLDRRPRTRKECAV